jgi:methionine--tRNA ligase beta chain
MEKELIEFQEFLEIEKKLDIRIGIISDAERVLKSKKLLKLSVMFNLNEPNKVVVTNIGDKIEPNELIGKKVPFILNLKPVTMMGITSEAMIIIGTSPSGEYEFENYNAGTKLI